MAFQNEHSATLAGTSLSKDNPGTRETIGEFVTQLAREYFMDGPDRRSEPRSDYATGDCGTIERRTETDRSPVSRRHTRHQRGRHRVDLPRPCERHTQVGNQQPEWHRIKCDR